jgi:hypothetical protein
MSTIDAQDPARVEADERPALMRAPSAARRRADRLIGKREDRFRRSRELAGEFDRLNGYLATAGKVTVALEQLSEQLLRQILFLVQEKLTIALQEILDSPIVFRAEANLNRGVASVKFWIERGGNEEDILLGQGGSVANVLSVGLRMFALTTLDESEHRRFLVLDEQDCWLRPDLVPRLVKIVHEASSALGFQVLMISHHDVALFEQYADRIYEFHTVGEGEVEVRQRCTESAQPDAE